MDEDITAGTVDEVLARVGTDTDLAAAALELEQRKPDEGEGKKRTTLIEALERIAAGDDNDEPDDDTQDEVGPEVFVATGADDPRKVKREADRKVGPERYVIQQGG